MRSPMREATRLTGFAERDDMAQAKATFESVRDGYEPSGKNDDILDNVNMRLKKIAQREK